MFKNLKTLDIVVARYNESLDWIDSEIKPYVKIFNKGANIADYEHIFNLRNVGKEGNTYLEYIIKNYDNLPNYVLFTQADLYDSHIKSHHVTQDDIKYIINNIDIIDNNYIGLNRTRGNDGWNRFNDGKDPVQKYGIPKLQKHLKDMWTETFNSELPNEIVTNYCAIFLVKKESILNHSIDIYKTLNKILLKDAMYGFALERLWTTLFDEDIEKYKTYPSLDNIKKNNSNLLKINDKEYKVKYYLIHGPNNERKQFMTNEFIKYKIDDYVKWILYPNVNDITDDIKKTLCSSGSESKGAIACTYKHFLALKNMKKEDYDIGVIMEDNIEFKNDVNENIIRYVKDMDDDWTFLFDSDILSNMKKFNPDPPSDGKSVLIKNDSKGANFVLVNVKNLKDEILNSFIPFHLHSDHYYKHIINKFKLKNYWSVPPNVSKRTNAKQKMW